MNAKQKVSALFRREGVFMQAAAVSSAFCVGNRDLSEQWEMDDISISIEGVGVLLMHAEKNATLASLTKKVHEFRSHRPCPVVEDARNSPWEILSFDRQKKRLKVRPVA